MKYVLDTLTKVELLGFKPRSSPIDSKPKFWDSTSPLLVNAHVYHRLMGKLIYLTVIHPSFTYTVGLLSQFMHVPQEIHWQATLRVLAYLKHAPERGLLYLQHGHLRVEAYSNSSYASNRGDRKSISEYYTFVGGNLITWWSKKQHVVSLSSVKAEYRAMMHASFEMLWVCYFLQELSFSVQGVIPMYCDNQAAIFFAKNLTFHERTKNIEIDCRGIRHPVLDGFITTLYVSSSHQLVDIIINRLSTASYDSISRKMGLFDLYASV